jgi:hypothetical protein
MVRRIKRSTLISMIAVIALLSLGIGYASWTQTLSINADVNTASFDVNWQSASTTDSIASNDIVGDPLNAASCEATINGDTLEVDIVNAYPNYSCTVTVEIHNDSEVPVELQSLQYLQEGNPNPTPYATELDVDPFGCENDTFDIGHEIAVNDSIACSFGVTVLAGSSSNVTYNLGAQGVWGVGDGGPGL